MSEGRQNAASSADLASGIVEDVRRLARLEVELAKQEAKELAIRNGVAAGLLATGGVLALFGLLAGLPFTLAYFLGRVWVGAAVCGAYVVVGALFALLGKARLRLAAPPRTLASLKETRAWVLRQISSSTR